MMKEKTSKWLALLLTGLLMISLCGMQALAAPADEEESKTSTSTTTSAAATSKPSSTTTSEPASTSSYHQTSSQSHATSHTTTTTPRATSTSRETTATTTTTTSASTSRASSTSTSGGKIGAVNDGSVTASWGTGYTETSSTPATTTSVASTARKNIANYAEAMQKLIWLPILLIILSVATLIFVNVRAHKKIAARKRRRFQNDTDIQSDSRRRRR